MNTLHLSNRHLQTISIFTLGFVSSVYKVFNSNIIYLRICCIVPADLTVMDNKYDESKKCGSEQKKKLKYLIFPWGNSTKVFHDVLEKRPDQWEELNYEKERTPTRT